MTEKLLIDILQEEYDRCCQELAPRKEQYRFRMERADDGSEHVEIVGDEYHIVVTERGSEHSRLRTNSRDEVLYQLVSTFSHQLASDFEARNREEGVDFRRMMFSQQVGLLSRVSWKWSERKQKEIEDILQKHPFDDSQ